MDKITKIALKIANKSLTIRQLLTKKFDIEIISGLDDSFKLTFSGPAQLTPEGIARWGANGTLDRTLLLDNNQAEIIEVLNKTQIQDLCSLFNTIAGNVNEHTYNKYIDN